MRLIKDLSVLCSHISFGGIQMTFLGDIGLFGRDSGLFWRTCSSAGS